MKILKFLVAVIVCFIFSGFQADAGPPDKDNNLIVTEIGYTQTEQGVHCYTFAALEEFTTQKQEPRTYIKCLRIMAKKKNGFGKDNYSYISRHRRTKSLIMVTTTIADKRRCKKLPFIRGITS